MMNTTYETYMNALKQGLASFDSAAAEEILNDCKIPIYHYVWQ